MEKKKIGCLPVLNNHVEIHTPWQFSKPQIICWNFTPKHSRTLLLMEKALSQWRTSSKSLLKVTKNSSPLIHHRILKKKLMSEPAVKPLLVKIFLTRKFNFYHQFLERKNRVSTPKIRWTTLDSKSWIWSIESTRFQKLQSSFWGPMLTWPLPTWPSNVKTRVFKNH